VYKTTIGNAFASNTAECALASQRKNSIVNCVELTIQSCLGWAPGADELIRNYGLSKTRLKGRLRRWYSRLVSKYIPSTNNPKLPHQVVANPDRQGIALVMIVKNEARYLNEWIAFHCMLGVRHIYIYDNMSDDDVVGTVKNSRFADRVTVTRWGNLHMRRQNMAYNHCIATFGGDYRWMGFLDADEFVFPVHCDSLPIAFEAFEQQPCLAVYWHMFGTSGHTNRPEGLVIENYNMREPFPPPKTVKSLCKVFVDPSQVVAAGVHVFEMRDIGAVNITQSGISFDQYCDQNSALYEGEILQLNHYYTRSKQDYQEKLERGGVARLTGADERRNLVEKRIEQIEASPVRDATIQRFIEPLKAMMQLPENGVGGHDNGQL